MPLTDLAARNAKPSAKPSVFATNAAFASKSAQRVASGGVCATRSKGKRTCSPWAVYPDVSLKDARERRDEARRLIANGTDPSAARKEEIAEAAAEALTFEHVAREWHERFKPKWSPSHSLDVIQRFEKNVFPSLGPRPIRDIPAPFPGKRPPSCGNCIP